MGGSIKLTLLSRGVGNSPRNILAKLESTRGEDPDPDPDPLDPPFLAPPDPDPDPLFFYGSGSGSGGTKKSVKI